VNVSAAITILQRLQQRFLESGTASEDILALPKIYFTAVHGGLAIEFFGSPLDESYAAFLQALCTDEVAHSVRSLMLRGPDEGANGTRNWDLTGIFQSDAVFPSLENLFIEPTAPEHHNQSIIGREYDEEGQIGLLLTRTPSLKSLTVPSAPDASFFQAGYRPLRFLQVDTGFAHQDFLRHLSQSDCFPDLITLDFGDYNQRYLEDYREDCTPFEQYEELFPSDAFQSVKRFNLRNSILSAEQLTHLRQLRKDLQFYVIQAYGVYLHE
jgi:hypothetical protein